MSVILSKNPADVLDYDVRFYRWLSEGDTVSEATATITGDSAVIDEVEVAEQTVKVWISGGTVGETYHVTVTATTQQGRVKEVCFDLKIKGC